MEKILDLLAEQTGGKCYTSFQYCFDATENPSIKYEEIQDYKLDPKRHGETDKIKTIKNISGRARQVEGNPLFKYFLDGSRRIYKVDDIEINKKIFPIIGGQIGVACCERQNPSTFRRAHLEHNLVMSLPSEADKDGRNSEQFFNSVAQKINNLPKLLQFNLKFSKLLSYSTKQLDPNEKLEDRGTAKIQDEMIECEKKIVHELAKKHLLNPNSYLLKDGSLQYQKTGVGDFRELSKFKSNYQCVVGVSKSFNPALDGNTKNASVIAKLLPYHRTPAFYYYGSRSQHPFSIWYVKIRDFKNHRPDSPFSGIVKVEKVLITDDEIENGLNSDEVDLISANLINERNPVAYGNDARGLGYCDTLIFETSFKGEATKSILTWNAKHLKEIINNRKVKEQAADVIDEVTSFKTEKEKADEHYFRVTLLNVSNEALLEKKDIEIYLSMVAPIPYHTGFILKQKIYDQLKKENISVDEYKIFINTNQLFKNYTTTIYFTNQKGEKLRTGDELFDIHFFREHTKAGDMLYWGWYGISQFEGVIDDINISKGIRLRKGNIQVGNKHTLLKFFRDTQRGNYYFFGEVHAFSSDLIPNARRDYFLENSMCHLFENKLRHLFHNELHQLYYDASKIRNANRRIQEVKTIQEESGKKEFVNNKEKEEFQKQFEHKKQEASKAKKELEKISSKFSDTDTAVKKIFEKVVDTHKINPEKIELQNMNGKTAYRVDKLTKLTKEQRKFLSRIYEIITANCDKKTAEGLIKKIEQELQ